MKKTYANKYPHIQKLRGAWLVPCCIREIQGRGEDDDLEAMYEYFLLSLHQAAKPALADVQHAVCQAIDHERARRCEEMPYIVPGGPKVRIKLKEEPPRKPRLQWVQGNASWGKTMVDDGDMETTDNLIAADDSEYPLTTQQWKELGLELQSWVRRNMDAAKGHMQTVMGKGSVDEVLEYDFVNGGWPE